MDRGDDPAPSTTQRSDLPLRDWEQSNLPQTPNIKIRSRRSSKLQRQDPRETSTERNARGSTHDSISTTSATEERVSHDLSLMDNNRSSVVDNMLQSLNPEPTKTFSPPRERPGVPSAADSRTGSRHLHSSSTNTDPTFPLDGVPERRSYQPTHGRRSNSSSNFPGILRPRNSISSGGDGANGPQSGLTQMSQVGVPSGHGHGHARKSHSKGSSGSASVDYGQMSTLFRGPPGLERRSASFDHGYRRRGLHSASSSRTHAPMPSSLSQPLMYQDDLEAAPTPTVPGGPRKESSPGFPPYAMQSPSSPRNIQGGGKAAKSQQSKKSKVDGAQTEVGATTNTPMSRRASKQMSSATAFMRSRNTSPTRQYSEPAMPQRQDANAPSKETTTNKPGFFRRVFGSSKTPSAAPNSQQSEANSQASRALSTQSGVKSNSANVNSSLTRSHKPAAAEDQNGSPQSAPPPLHKKPSSFFRRRKKSVTENIRPPLLPIHVQQNANAPPVEPAQHSPVSSLRKVMNAYLDGPTEKSTGPGPGDASTPLAKNKLRGQKSFDPILPPDDHNSNEIKPSPPRDVPSQEQIAAAQSEWDPDNYLSRPPDTTFLHNFNSTVKRKTDSPSDREVAAPRVSGSEKGRGSRPNAPAQRRTKSETSAGESAPSHGDSSIPAVPDLAAALLKTSTTSKTFEMKKQSKETTVEGEETTKPPQDISAASGRQTPRLKDPGESAENGEAKRPADAAETSPASDYHSASSTVHPLHVTGKDEIKFPGAKGEKRIEDKTAMATNDATGPSENDIKQAKCLFEGDESIATKENTAAWLGEPSPERAPVRRAYLELFQFQGLNILTALRQLCSKLYLKGEAQQVDRVLDAFSTRWCACNPNHGFKAIDVVHTICYSLLLLNTDLHQAEIETKMTRSQFLKNILPTIRRVVTDAAPDAFVNPRASTISPARPWVETSASASKKGTSNSGGEERRSFEGKRPSHTLSQRPSDQATYTIGQAHTPVDFSSSVGEGGPLVKAPFIGKLSVWENQIEVILKDFYHAVRQQPLPLHGNEAKEQVAPPETPQTTNSLSAMNSLLRRTPSMLSKAGSETISYTRGRALEGRMTTGRWQSKNRSRPRLYPASTVASSRRSSFDEQSSITSPSVISTWSKFSSFGRTQTSFSVESFGSHFPPAQYQQSIGFANALSQAIIREENPTTGDEESLRAAPLLEDESLELAGAPWAKEGILKHKHHLEAVDKRAKDRNWVESFAVIEKGQMRLFSFSTSARSLRQKAKNQKFSAPGGPVGGGNWADNAEVLGSFALRHTIASALPPPGYSKARPHVWALSLPTGAVHLFQVGTPEIVKEFVTTANYWSARLSKEPLVGAISNIEYGWGDAVINTALLTQNHTENTPLALPGGVLSSNTTNPSPAPAAARPSLQSSIRSARSSFEQSGAMGTNLRPKLPGDKININEWLPPQQSMTASALLEIDQLKALTNYVKKIEEELSRHNELRGPMVLAYHPRGNNNTRAMTNWERKSSYLLREIVKFRTYIDCLQAAQGMKEGILKEKEKSIADGAQVGSGEATAEAATSTTTDPKPTMTVSEDTTSKEDATLQNKLQKGAEDIDTYEQSSKTPAGKAIAASS